MEVAQWAIWQLRTLGLRVRTRGLSCLFFETHKFHERNLKETWRLRADHPAQLLASTWIRVRLRLGRSSLLRRLDELNPSSIPGLNLAIFFTDPTHKFQSELPKEARPSCGLTNEPGFMT